MHSGKWFILILVIMCIGCRRQGNRFFARTDASGQESSVEQIINLQRKAMEAENVVITFVKNDTHQWVQHEFGWWYRYTHLSEEHPVSYGLPTIKDTCCVIHECVYSLDGRQLVDAIREFNSRDSVNEECKEPMAYRMMLSEMTATDTVILLIPWTFGYGQQGSGRVPPYTNLYVRLNIHSSPYNDAILLTDTIPTDL